jgi:hypothetical protein
MIKITLTIILCTALCAAQGQNRKIEAQHMVDSLLELKIDNFRIGKNLGQLIYSEVLGKSSRHHSYYMATTKIVSHYQTMNLVSMPSIYSPKKRIEFFDSNDLPYGTSFSEVVVGISSKNKNPEEIANSLFKAMTNSENILTILDERVNYVGLSTVKRKNHYFLTVKFGMESNVYTSR